MSAVAVVRDVVQGWMPRVRCVVADYGGVLDLRPGADVGDVPSGYEGVLYEAFGHQRQAGKSFPVAPMAAEAIRALRRLGLGVLVASNTLPGQSREPALTAAGVRDLLGAVLHSAELGAAKPSAEFFDALAAAAGSRPKEICYVGNRVSLDVLPALAAGMRGVLIAPSWSAAPDPARTARVPDCVAVISHVRHLPGLFAPVTGAVR
ncbi:HAD family hydrolase [Actinomadura chibensis]|uniref:HAD family hydrolase n=1 Tax=Actinomadura chibensis TaxID=392828 RepID=A0A5D0NHK3_9ACTN|nr:HAD family hydrolase [Actinomadura chibensis]TYB43880.1 HAD family hydrolase [Actinomadura chibensis]